MTCERAWLVGLFLPACVVHESGTNVAITVEASPVVTNDRGFGLSLKRAVLVVHEVHLEPCPEAGLGALLEALSPIGVAHAHSGYLSSGTGPIQAMSLIVPSTEAIEIQPTVGEYCGLTPLFAPGDGQPTLQIELEVTEPGDASPRALTIASEAWIRPELPMATMVIDEAQPEARVTLSIDGQAWWSGLDLDREDPATIGARLVERLGSALSARRQGQ